MKRVKQQNSRQKNILRTAVRLFKRSGFYNVSIEDIVKASETSIATFYSYFGSKDEVVCEHRNNTLAGCEKFYRSICEDEEYAELSGLDKVQLLLCHVMELVESVGAEFCSVFAQRRVRERDAQPEDKPYLPLLTELIVQGQADGSIRQDRPAEVLAAIADDMLQGSFLYWQLQLEGRNMAKYSIEMAEALCHTLSAQCALSREEPELFSVWETAYAMLVPDPRSGIKQVEESWLEQWQ